MLKTKIKIIFLLLVLFAGAVFLAMRLKYAKTEEKTQKEVVVQKGNIREIISTTGTVLPKNRLEVKPPVNGRIESILVREGEYVKSGQTLAWMSSTERAALLDAARGKGETELKYWEEAYKAIPLISPIDGEIIVATTQPGQTVTTSDAVVVLSDKLIVRAQVDETDIGKIRLGQNAILTIDAYPDTKIGSVVEHIYYESELVNNVTIYKVDLIPEEIPQFFRSGMNASVDFIIQSRESILVIPLEAVYKENGSAYVILKQDNVSQPLKTAVRLGISDDKNTEVISGISEGDTVLITSKKYALPTSSEARNPFMPQRRR